MRPGEFAAFAIASFRNAPEHAVIKTWDAEDRLKPTGAGGRRMAAINVNGYLDIPETLKSVGFYHTWNPSTNLSGRSFSLRF